MAATASRSAGPPRRIAVIIDHYARAAAVVSFPGATVLGAPSAGAVDQFRDRTDPDQQSLVAIRGKRVPDYCVSGDSAAGRARGGRASFAYEEESDADGGARSGFRRVPARASRGGAGGGRYLSAAELVREGRRGQKNGGRGGDGD